MSFFRRQLSRATRLAVAVLACALAPLASASGTLEFTASSDLAALVVSTSGNAALVHDAAAGAGSPATGGLRFVPSGTGTDRVVSAWRATPYGFDTATSLTTSALVNFSALGGEEASFHLGFVNDHGLAAPATDKDFLKKKGAGLTYIGAVLKYNRKNNQLETLIGNKATTTLDGSEFAKLTQAITTAEMVDWLRLTLVVTPVAGQPGEFTALARVESLGPAGLSAPVLVREFTAGTTLPNASLASASSGRVALLLTTKNRPADELRLDTWSAVVPGPPPAAPLALPAEDVGGSTFTALWEAPSGGPATYTVEVSTAANAFAPGTLISATGAPGHTSGFTVAAPATSAVVSGLSPDTAYVYRLFASSANGDGPRSNTISVTTLAAGTNLPPTLDPIPDLGFLSPAATPRVLTLTGISPGPGETASVTLSAASSAPAIIPVPLVSYTDSSPTGTLSFVADGSALGPVTLSATVDDGASTLTRAFTATVRQAPEALGFVSDTELADEFSLFSSLTTPSWQSAAGTGSPASPGLRVALGASSGDRLLVGWRRQPLVAAEATSLSTSLSFRLTGLVKEGEVRVGFATDTTPGAPVDKDFLKKGNGAVRSLAAFAKHKVEDNQLEIGLLSRASAADATEAKFTLPAFSTLAPVSDWFRLTLHASRSGAESYAARYVLEHLGPDGSATPVVLAESAAPVHFAHAPLAQALDAWPVFFLGAKKEDAGPLFADDHEALALREPPSAPAALAATERTANSLRAHWSYPAAAPYVAGFTLELSPAAHDFAPAHTLSFSLPGNATDHVVTGLSPATPYRYRVRALNFAGSGPLSNVVEATTLLPGENAPPTLDALADRLVSPDLGSLVIPLSGLSTGGETDQTLLVTATSSAPGLVSVSDIHYTAPASSGQLVLALPSASATGSATITVTVDDGRDTVSRAFVVTVQTPPALVSFDAPGAGLDAFTVHTFASTVSTVPGAGAGDPPGAAGYYRGDIPGAEHGALLVRAQDYANAPGTTLLRTSLLVHFREIVELESHRGELRLGFADHATPGAELKKFFEEGRHAVSARLSGEHKPEENKAHLIKLRLLSGTLASGKSESSELTFVDPAAFDSWLRLSLDAVPLSATQIELRARVEDLGADGLGPARLIAAQTFVATNPGFLAAPRVHPAIFLNAEKTVVTHGVFFDEHRVERLTTAPEAPATLPPPQLTNASFRAAWSAPVEGAPPTGYEVAVSTAASAFAPGSLLAADGGPGQSSPIAVGRDALDLRIAGLDPSTAYVFRVRGVNLAGPGAWSDPRAVTTLGHDENAPPTLDPITDLDLAVGALDFVVPLTGISDGGEGNQWVWVTATSSNPALIPDPFVLYDYEDTGELYLEPVAGATGTAVITVTVDDGAWNTPTFTRSFTVRVLEPVPLLPFTSAADLAGLEIHATEAALVHAPAPAGPASAPGALRFTRSAVSQDHVALALRPLAHDARTAPGFAASVFVRADELLATPSGQKDQLDIRLGFVTRRAPSATLKDTLHATSPSLGLRFRFEHEPAKADKFRRLSAELYHRNATTTTTSSSGDLNFAALDAPAFGDWLHLRVEAVRSASNTYQLFYAIDSWGPDGAAFVANLFTSAPWTLVNAPFGLSDSVYAALLVSGEKSRSASALLDQWRSDVPSLAPDAPAPGAVTAIGPGGFTLAWSPASLGTVATGYVVEVSRAADLLRPGTLLAADGSGGRATGVSVSGYGSGSLAFTGLAPGQSYLWRVRAVAAGRTGPARSASLAATTGSPFTVWSAGVFTSAQLADPAVSGPLADPDGDGLPNLLEYAFGSAPLGSDAVSVLPAEAIMGEKLRLAFRRRTGASGLLYIPESSADLATWSHTEPVVVSVTPDADAGFELVVVEDPVPLGPGAPRRFLRVRVEVSP